MATDNKPIFLVGMARSGTSLCRALLQNHSRIAMPVRGELQFFENWYAKHGALDDAENLGNFSRNFFENSKFPRLEISPDEVLERFGQGPATYAGFFTAVMETFAAKKGKPRWAEKSTSHIDHLETLVDAFPGSPIILIVRDPRDTFLSLQHAPWREGAPLEPRRWIAHWRKAYGEAVRTVLTRGVRCHVYKHECMIENPEEEMRKLLTFLGEEVEPACTDLSQSGWEQNSSFGESSSKVTSTSVGRWRNQLPRSDAREIELGWGEVGEFLGYSRPRPRWATRRRFRRLRRRLPGWALELGRELTDPR